MYLGEIYVDRSEHRGIDLTVLSQACQIVDSQSERSKRSIPESKLIVDGVQSK